MREGYILLDDVATQLGVKRPTLYYYLKVLEIESKKFPLDKRKYLRTEDFEKIREAKRAAQSKTEAA